MMKVLRSEHARLTIVGVLMLASVATFAASYAWRATRPEPWNPLYGPVAGQTVQAQTANYIDIEGQKCNRSARPVWVRGSLVAQPVKPRGIPVMLSTGQTVRLPGCTAVKFRNVYPDELLDYTERSGGPVIWYFSGTETPVGECAAVGGKPLGPIAIHLETDDGKFECWERPYGTPWAWNTENFTLPVPEGLIGNG